VTKQPLALLRVAFGLLVVAALVFMISTLVDGGTSTR